MSNKSKKSAPAKPKAPDPDDAVTIAVTKWRSIVAIAKTGIWGACVPLSLLVLWPIASVLAGKETTVNVTVAITLTIALSISTGAATLWGNHQKKKADAARGRVTQLEGQLLILQQENDSLTRQNQMLERQLPSLTRQNPPDRKSR